MEMYRTIKNFSLEEMQSSETAKRENIENMMGETEMLNMSQVMKALQGVRDVIKRPITVTSGYRSKALNKRIGGAESSKHMRGMAADVMIKRCENESVYEFRDAKNKFASEMILALGEQEFTKLIFEIEDDDRKWIHAEVSDSEQGEVMLIVDGVTISKINVEVAHMGAGAKLKEILKRFEEVRV